MAIFKITIDSKEHFISKPSEKGVASIIVTSLRDETPTLEVVGYIPEEDTHMDWIKSKLEVGSKINIEVIEFSPNHKMTEPINTRTDGKDMAKKEKVKYYFKLKEELEQSGLI